MRLWGLGLARRLGSRHPRSLRWLMGAREGGKEGRTWGVGSHRQLQALPGSVWKGL